MPVLDPEKDKDAPKPYNTLRVSQEIRNLLLQYPA